MIPRTLLQNHLQAMAVRFRPRPRPRPRPISSPPLRLSPLPLPDDEDLVLPKPAIPLSASAMPNLLQPRVLIYDGVCHLCHRGVRWLIKTDKHRKIKFCCLQSRAAQPYLRLLALHRQDVRHPVLFVEGLAAYYQGSAAVLMVASYLPFPYSALSSLLIIPAPLRDAVYDYIAKNRYKWFGRADECIVMRDKELLDRFIDRDEMFGGRHSF
ncbi:Nucleic acid binding protein [Rhynchospora pubera]|uniref:Nucleic acid binding protein n=1 Tax=Rhynchospora pubera TaxID=906938 RepID=A0AAV8HB73_9POAL|nr:Nucleic acid binding protein [Rhynchospora pubera]